MSTGSDEQISGTKIQPLDASIKQNVPHDTSDRGATGTNRSIDQARINPLGGRGQYQHPEPHADSQGASGREDALAGAKIEPLEGEGNVKDGVRKGRGLDDENVDAARINPLGEVREQIG